MSLELPQGSYSTELRPISIERQKVPANDILERRRRYLVRWTGIKAERTRQWATWQSLTDYIIPERGRFMTSDHNKTKDTKRILNGMPTKYLKSLAAAMMSGITSPARPWFSITLPDPEMAEWAPMRAWLYQTNERIRQVLALGNFYKAAAQGTYLDLGGFGTSCCLVEEDPIKVVRFTPLPIGSYGLAQDGQGHINTLMYEEPWTVAELVDEFGWENVSASVKTAYNASYYEQYVLVLRIIAPNPEFIPGRADRLGKRWGSVYMELGGMGQASGSQLQPSTDPVIGFLRDSGYEEFPVLAPRWAATGRDVYGTGPGHDALPDVRQLMKLESRSLLAVDKGVNPPMLLPESMRQRRVTMQPGDPTYVPSGTTQKVEPAQVVRPEWLDKNELKIRQAESRIGQFFFSDLVSMFISPSPTAGKQPVTAEEIRAKQQENMLLLGPVLENLNDEFLAPLIQRVYSIMDRRGLIPPAPKEAHGMPLNVQFISILAQAQKLIHTTAKERVVAFVGQVAALQATQNKGGGDALDNLDTDEMIRLYVDDVGAPPTILTTDEIKAQTRQQRAQAQQAAQQGQAMAMAAKGAKDASGASLEGDNLLTRMIGPVAGAQAGEGATE